MKTKGKLLSRVSNFFKFNLPRPVDCHGTETGSDNTQTTETFPSPALNVQNFEDERLRNNVCSIEVRTTVGFLTTLLQRRFARLSKPQKFLDGPVHIQAQPSYEIDLNDDDGLSDYLTFRHGGSINVSNYLNSSPTPDLYNTFPYLPEIQTIDPEIPNMNDHIPHFQYCVATSKISLELLFKQSHVWTNENFWNTLLVPSNPSRQQDPGFNVQVLVPLPSGHSASVDTTMQVGVFYCHRSVLISQSPHFREIISSGTSGERRDGAGIDIVTLKSPPFTVETVRIALEFMYKAAKMDLPSFDLQPACGDLTSSEPFLLYKTAQVLGLSSLVKRVSSELIVQKLLHRNPSKIITNTTEFMQSLRGKWSNPSDNATCRCSSCAHSAPQVLLFSVENGINDVFLEHASRQTLLESFGIAWCTNEFASLPQDITDSISDNLLSAITPQNSLPLLFATEGALSVLEHSPASTQRVLSMMRKAIEDLILKDPASCFSSPEWAKMSNSSSSEREISPDDLVKLRWICETLNRIKPSSELTGENSEYIDGLCHLVAELQLMTTYPSPSPSHNPTAEDRVSFFTNSSVRSSSYRHSWQVASIFDSSAPETTPPPTRLMLSSFGSTTQGSIESLPNSRASSRTTATDYGLFYTQLGLSPPPSFIERPIPSPRVWMSPRLPQHIIYRRSPLGLFSPISPGDAVDLSVTPYTVPRRTPDSPHPASSSSKSAGLVSSDSEAPTAPIEQPPSYDLVQQQDISRENEDHHVQDNVSRPTTEFPIGDPHAEDHTILQQQILELQSTSARLQETLVKHETYLKEAVDRLKVYHEQTDMTNVRDQARLSVVNGNICSPTHSLIVPQTATANIEGDSIQDYVGHQRPSSSLIIAIESRNPLTADREQGTDQRFGSLQLANSATKSSDIIRENFDATNLQRSVMDVKTFCNIQLGRQQHRQCSESTVLAGPSAIGLNQSPHVAPSSDVLEDVEAERNDGLESDSRHLQIPLVAGMENPRTSLYANSTNVEDDSRVDQPEEEITKDFSQLDEYLAHFEDRLMRYKSSCEERFMCRSNGTHAEDIVNGYSRQEKLQQKELVDRLDTVVWKIKEGRKTLSEVCRQIHESTATSKQRQQVEIPWQDDQMKILEHVLVSLLRKRSSKKRSPRLTRWRDNSTYVTRKGSERRLRSNALRYTD